MGNLAKLLVSNICKSQACCLSMQRLCLGYHEHNQVKSYLEYNHTSNLSDMYV